MIVELTPQDEELIRKRLDSGAFSSIPEIIHQALASLDAEEVWLQENKSTIDEEIGKGIAQLDSGEGLSAEDSRSRLRERKAGWLARKQR